jgi:Ca2+-binding EF-hand superfamily protein
MRGSKKGSCLTLAALLVLTAPVLADTVMEQKYRNIDINSDGRVTRNEWRAAFERSFDNHDWNKDGILSGDEVKTWKDSDDEWQSPSRWRGGRRWSKMAKIDQNNDGQISRSEWKGSGQDFDRIDNDRNGFLTSLEIREYRFDQLDVNRDGRIARSEWRGRESEFDALDLNKNGVLRPSEYLNPTQAGQWTFLNLDTNRDGKIVRSEWKGTVVEFDRLDRNDDAALNEQEYYYEQNTSAAGSGSTTQTLIEQIFEQFLSNQ